MPTPTVVVLACSAPEAEPVAGEYRRIYTPGGERGMPWHVTLLAPFADVESFDEQIAAKLQGAIGDLSSFEFALTVAEELEDRSTPTEYASAPLWLNEAYPELFAHPRLRERISLYDVARWAQGLHRPAPEARSYAMAMIRATVEGNGLIDRLVW